MNRLLILLTPFLLAGCHPLSLTCRSEYLYPTYLASSQVMTPNPGANCFYGQQIIVCWAVPKRCFKRPVTLLLHVRYGNREIQTFSVPINRRCGYWVYRLVKKDYWCRGGILSFQAQLEQEGVIIDEWNHYLWAQILDIPSLVHDFE